ncbi:MAG: DUF5591 domain-containing protein [bacterium]|nr:DUF5591 domain-containing protein [bacterium]
MLETQLIKQWGIPEPGVIVLKGGDELFFNEHVLRFYNHVLNERELPERPIALYFGCSYHKPFSRSFLHLKTIRMLKKHDLDDLVQQFIISEPLTICPRELEATFPAANYDFPPERLGHKGREEFVKRLSIFLHKRASNTYGYHVVFAPNHHREIFGKASKNLLNPTYVPYNLYQLPKLLHVLKEIKK